VLDVLRRQVGVANPLLSPGAALIPEGDEITADIACRGRTGRCRALGRTDRPHPRAIHAVDHLPDVPHPGVSAHRDRCGHRPVRHVSEVDFIFHVGPLSFVVALLAGAAGMLSLVSAKSTEIVGVFISVYTVTAAGYAVVAATVGEWDVAAKSALQLVVNLVGIVVAGVLVLVLRPRGSLIPRAAHN
jgi:hypothetical protein